MKNIHFFMILKITILVMVFSLYSCVVSTRSNTFTLISPSAARTSSSVAFIWHKPEDRRVACYQVFADGKIHGIVSCTDYSAEGLKPGTEYGFFVRAIDEKGVVLYKSNSVIVTTKPAPDIFNIKSFGALPDGFTVNTESIQKAINACTPGGIVYIPEGEFLSGAIFLKSDMTLMIEKNGRLTGTANAENYPIVANAKVGRNETIHSSLINTIDYGGNRLHDITIMGEGVIDANGIKLMAEQVKNNRDSRGRAIFLCNVDRLYLKDITVRQSPSWCVHMVLCNDVSANNIKIHTRFDEYGRLYKGIHNGDGVNPEYCKDVYIFHSRIASQDDCIAIKAGRNEVGRAMGVSTENIRITNCLFESGFGVAVGSEMSACVRNVFVQDCVFKNAYSIGTVKGPRGRGGVVENVVYTDCVLSNHDHVYKDCEWFRGAINIDNFYSFVEYDVDKAEEFSEKTPVFRNITFRNIVIDTSTGNAVFMAGLPESPLQNIRLENVSAIGKTGLKAYNIDGLILKNVHITAREGDAMLLHNVVNLYEK